MAKKLLRRLIQKATGRIASRKPQEPADSSLRPPGERSGKGSSSIEPYLNQSRNTRPGPLE
jgi:hypothetical protein